MTGRDKKRRHPAARYAVLLMALVVMGGAYTLVASPGQAETGPPQGAGILAADEGKQIYEENCMSCHAPDLKGKDSPESSKDGGKDGKLVYTGPSLEGLGGAAVDFQVSTGRMPSTNPDAQMQRNRPRLNEEQIAALVAYVQQEAGGPTVEMARAESAKQGGDAAKGGALFRANCIQCHNFAGSGGALTEGRSAPELKQSTPLQIYEAMLTGPGPMPLFSEGVLTPEDKRSIIKYIEGTRDAVDPGGLNLGRFGPVTEGLVGWIVGVGLMILAAMWLTGRQRRNNG